MPDDRDARVSPRRCLAELGQGKPVSNDQASTPKVTWPRHRRGEIAGPTDRVLAPDRDMLAAQVRPPQNPVLAGDDDAEHLVLTGDEPRTRQPDPQPAVPATGGRLRGVRVLRQDVPPEG